jgi:hypothetical protein
MYGGHRIVPLEWAYGMSRSKRSNEVLILSNDLPAPCAVCAQRLAQRSPLEEALAELYRRIEMPASR